jgi:hypothetical protein
LKALSHRFGSAVLCSIEVLAVLSSGPHELAHVLKSRLGQPSVATTALNRISRLTYDNMQTHSGEFFGRTAGARAANA